jgi:YegS/Rv2252/BmrU family lipid kinase
MISNIDSALLLVNPNAGGGKALRAVAAAMHQLETAGLKVRKHISSSQQDLVAAVSTATESRIYLLAGDGSLRAAAELIVQQQLDIQLAPLPAGRGNDFCAVIGIDSNITSAIAKSLLNPELLTVDVMSINQQTIALGAVSIGLDAAAARVAHEIQDRGIKWLRGAPLYLVAAITALAKWQTAQIVVQLDDGLVEAKDIWLFVVSNSGQFGGGMKISPHSKLQDGLLEIVSVGKVSKLNFLFTLPKVFSGRHLNHSKLQLMTTKKVLIESKLELLAFADGEPVGKTPLNIAVLPAALKIIK